MDENLAKVQAEDAKQHPNCGYYTNVSKSCRVVNGEGRCEVVQRLWRRCPWRRDRLVHEQRTEEEMDSGGMGGLFGGGSGPHDGEQLDDPFAIFDEMRRQHEGARVPRLRGVSRPHAQLAAILRGHDAPMRGGGGARASPGEPEPPASGEAPSGRPQYDRYIRESKAV